MSHFEYTKGQLEELIDAYEAYCDEIGQTYYNQDDNAIEAAWARVRKIREQLGVPVD